MSTGHCFFKLNKCCHPSEIKNQWNTKPGERSRENFISSRVQKSALPSQHNKSCFCPSSEDYENMFQRSYFFAALTCKIFSTTEEDFRVSARPCNAFCLYILCYLQHSLGSAGREGTKIKIDKGWLSLKVRPLTFLYTVFGRKDTPFVYLPFTNGP